MQLSLAQVLLAVAVGALLAPLTVVAVAGYQKSAQAAQYPVEVSRLLAASRAFVKDQLRLPDLSGADCSDSGSTSPDSALWRNYYRPAAEVTSCPQSLLPDGLRYQTVRAFTPAGVTVGSFPGRIRISGSWCDRYDGDPNAFCEYDVPVF
ncbi:hypothetical protein [Gloeobacter kilaueensis]|uniref:Uncharacterized protein n=1 Tax=Gloeobacter kilaueensis (strain ATCC BAA-2537 / CCAP 1431/1 / ULC 316 / JS1) TaxID=1183438 RepID=U5QS02_GLOK1|nr:hypothetical protein [Gloeobacter kilaueensis]AGY60399.1 hypothetical protein GKIL_4153 [Gloeobacter kilaueensis JS1]